MTTDVSAAPGAPSPANPGTAVPPAQWGRVTLVGAGPGDAELLTLKAARVLASARTVLYDHLVSHDVLAHVAPGAELIYVGKQSRNHTLPQEGIIELMVRLAQQGKSLVRLKGGDPYIFGRGGEEAQALAAAGIACDTVPGISAAQGAAAAAGIPLTHRDHAGMLVFATGHLQGEEGERTVALDWDALARPRQTVVIYMGVGTLPVICAQLVRHGMAAETPAALIERATLPEQRTIVGTLQTLPELAVQHAVRAPALIVIGTTVSLHAVIGAGAEGRLPVPAAAPPAAPAARTGGPQARLRASVDMA
ncbi:uroporphyrinogen-III C-methyltransferase [Acidovorax sp. SRB_14]|uniref:uroporphyrinogen-III C-methyltransferase n=1 Tax=unclassified Acidovorax TaxID=2684926 RepID=UPI00145D7530|nr:MULTISPECIES: uroporphyrinogen-III C-methyltransferase [unclassified Acidovorax]NMM79042.1 uroporphyrinogen-III C-methyltransferase [Acidovorax sp. SRB_24]NMM80225.1 uroporphyrinogen-III C-methyltransferase [Acidovorax sp. SRB_14]NMM91606.1 uroporphyrinogen-III C-methyltransferase [Rhodococcus sp. SRB_17]